MVPIGALALRNVTISDSPPHSGQIKPTRGVKYANVFHPKLHRILQSASLKGTWDRKTP